MADYAERYGYDPNGNILTLNRHGTTGTGGSLNMDSLSYEYIYQKTGGGGAGEYVPGQILPTDVDHLTNQLGSIRDAVTSTGYDDIKNQMALNYKYDATGNLVADSQARVSGINWSVYGKILNLTDSGNLISFTYDAAGNRISKTAGGITTWYVRDAQVNVLAVYEQGDGSHNSGALTETEVHLYGSSRLGMQELNVNCAGLGLSYPLEDTLVRGVKFFELTNHLGNVLATVSDKKLQHTSDGTTVDYYNPDVITAQDYYSFGMPMPGRSFNAGSYRYGFNGQEKDDEIKGSGNSYGAEFWEYDPRIGRRWNVDPIYKNSPYEAFGNNPNLLEDPNGADTFSITRTKIIQRIKGQGDEHSDILRIPEKIITQNDLNVQITPGDGKDIFIFQENIFNIDENGNETATLGKPIALDPDDWRSTHPGVTQGTALYFDGLMTGTEDNTDRISVALFMDMDANFKSYMLSHHKGSQEWLYQAGSLDLMRGLMPPLVKAGFGSYIGFRFATAEGTTLEYDPRVRLRGIEDPTSHNFPYSFDEYILRTKPILKNNGYNIYQQEGEMMGSTKIIDGKPVQTWKTGIFEIGMNKDGVIDHRFFRPY